MKAHWTQRSPCLWLCPFLSSSLPFCLFCSLSHLFNTCIPNPGCRELEEETRIQLWFVISVKHLVGSMVCVPEMDVHFPSPEFGIIKGGIPPFSWESKSLEPNISSDFMDAQTRKSLMEGNLEGEEDGQIALGSLLDYFEVLGTCVKLCEWFNGFPLWHC